MVLQAELSILRVVKVEGINVYRSQKLRLLQAQSYADNSKSIFEIGRRIGKDINTTALDLRYKFFPNLAYIPPISWINPNNLGTGEIGFNAALFPRSFYNNGKLRYSLNSADGALTEFSSGGVSTIQIATNVQAFYNFMMPVSLVGSAANIYIELGSRNRIAKDFGASTIDLKASLLCEGYTVVPLSATVVVSTSGKHMIQLFSDYARKVPLTAGQLAATAGGNVGFVLTYTADSLV